MKTEPAWRIDHVLVSLLLAGMALIAFANVVGRYFFHYSISFTEELTINMFVCMSVVGTGIAFERGSHLGMVTLLNVFPDRARRGVAILSAVLGAALYVVVDIILIYSIYKEMAIYKTKSSMGIYNWVYYLCVVLCTPFVFKGILRGMRTRLDQARREGK